MSHSDRAQQNIAPSQSENGSQPEAKEFGGTIGVIIIMIFSHTILYYMWICWQYYGGAMALPDGFGDIPAFFGRMGGHIADGAAPTLMTVGVYVGFLIFQGILAIYLPGPKVKGLPIPHQGNIRLEYNINGAYAWYITLALVATLHFTGIFSLTLLVDNFASFMTVAIIAGNLISILTYVGAKRTGNTHRMSGSAPYDFFMGAWLNPRIGKLDLKMWSEIRISWMLLFFLTAGAVAKYYELYGSVSTPMIFMLVAHGLYANATMKGEECIPTTWDIFHEKWGWMLIFWNFAGVPFLYCFNTMYLLQKGPFEHSVPFTILCFVLLIGAYYVWDCSQSQRNRFRMQERGTYFKRWTFPQVPYGLIKNPKYIETKAGSKLLINGFWAYARKIHYTADIVMALSWGLICGFDNYLPYFYVTFFVLMIIHRATRDMARCKLKYGEDWDKYCKKVPYIFIPGVI